MASSDHEQRSGLAGAAGRAAFFSARTAARAWRDEFESAVDEVLSAPEIARLVDSALAGPLPDEIARSIVRHRVIDRVVAELASSGELDRLLSAALASPRALEFTDRVLASDATRHALREVASSPEVRDAIFRQTTGLFEDVLGIVRSSAVRLDDSVERPVRRGERPERTDCAGIVTRALALFVLFWSTTGQTPGMRLFRLRVHSRGAVPSVGRSIVRMVGLVLAIVPFFLGFVPVLFDERRRGLPDFLASTVVEYEDEQGS